MSSSSSPSAQRSRAAVIGAGPVGCLAALSLAARGFEVDIYERRPDPRSNQIGSTSGDSSSASKRPVDRSINLAISSRGLKALATVEQQAKGGEKSGENLANVVLSHAVPMKARMIHTKPEEGKEVELMSQAYGMKGEHINSVSRGLLNTLLLDEASSHPSISLHFSSKLRSIDLEAAEHHGNDAQAECSLTFDAWQGSADACTRWASLVVGCDGINSLVRNTMAKLVPLDFQQEYIDSEYLELRMPPKMRTEDKDDKSGKASAGSSSYAIDPHHLHIWPRHSFMLIALPNLDYSFTATLFAPNAILSTLTSREAVLDFFRREFPDALPLFDEEDLMERILPRKGRGSRLSSIRCSPYHFKGRAVILGDAAHAMLPFYGQGLNCGFEDVGTLAQLLDEHGVRGDTTSDPSNQQSNLSSSLSSYTTTRHADLVAIVALAAENYRVMSSRVVDPLYLLRKQLDGLLMTWLPTGWWSSLYNLVTFSPDVGYSRAREQEEWQQRVLQRVIVGAGAVAVAGMVGLGWVARSRGWLKMTTTTAFGRRAPRW